MSPSTPDVHLRLSSQRFKEIPDSVNVAELCLAQPKSYLDVRPMEPTLGSAVALARRGAPSLLADGGLGISHFPMTRSEFHDAEPRPIAKADVPPTLATAVADWRARGAKAFGEKPPPRVGALFMVPLQAIGVVQLGFGVVEGLLEVRPPDVAAIRSGESSEELLAIGHLPLRHASFTEWHPKFVQTALVDPQELQGYEKWKLAKGRFF